MVWKATVFASLLCFSLLPSPALASADAQGCLAVDPASFEEVHPDGPLAGYAGWTTAVGLSKERLPLVPTLLAQRDGMTCDLTHGLAAFVGARASPADPADALALAKLAVGAIHVDVLPDAVPAADAAIAASAPRVAPIAGGYAADLRMWTPRNGVVADVHVVMDGAISVSFVVVDRAVGDFRGEIEGWNLMPGMTDAIVAGDVSGLTTKVITAANADGVQWRVTYFTQNYANEAEADLHANMHLQAGLRAYANETSWGLVSADPDGILDLTLNGCDCISSGFHANIRMFPRAYDILPLLPGLAYRSEAETAELILGHELFHHFQYSIMQWGMSSWTIEGMARFSETVAMPDATFLPTTLTYHQSLNGMNGYLSSTQNSLTAHSYDWSIVWGWLYAHDGGIAMIVDVLHEMDETPGNDLVNGIGSIQRAMDDTPGGEHATFAESFRAFAGATLTREGFVWGTPEDKQVHDWATYFIPVERERRLYQPSFFGSPGPFQLTPWTFRFHDAAPEAPELAGALYVGQLDAAFFVKSHTGWSFAAANSANIAAAADDAALLVSRGGELPSIPDVGTANGFYYAASLTGRGCAAVCSAASIRID